MFPRVTNVWTRYFAHVCLGGICTICMICACLRRVICRICGIYRSCLPDGMCVRCVWSTAHIYLEGSSASSRPGVHNRYSIATENDLMNTWSVRGVTSCVIRVIPLLLLRAVASLCSVLRHILGFLHEVKLFFLVGCLQFTHLCWVGKHI